MRINLLFSGRRKPRMSRLKISILQMNFACWRRFHLPQSFFIDHCSLPIDSIYVGLMM